MIEQLPLLPIVEVSTHGTISERFERFHAANPHVYAHLVALTRELVELGHKRVGLKMIWERLRLSLRTSGDKYRLNNSFTALYAREIMSREPDLAGVFETRDRRAA